MKIALAGPTLTSSLRDMTGAALPNAPPGTAATPLAPLAAGLLAAGHDVHIVTTDPTIDATVTVGDSRLTVTYCPLRGAPRYPARHRSLDLFETEIRRLTAAMEDAAPDIVHAHWTYEFAEAAVRSRLPHLVTMHDLAWSILAHRRDAYRLMRLIMKLRTMPRVRHLSVVAPFMQARTLQHGFFGKSVIIPNAIAVPAFDPGQSETKLARPPKFVTIGDRGRLKNVVASMAAFPRIREHHPDAELHLFGPELDAGFCGPSSANVVAHGNVRHGDLMDFLSHEATVLIHPSRLEACPAIVMEAKARGVPVVGGARSGGVPYVCGADQGALLVDIDKPEAIALAASTIVGQRDVYTAMARKAHADTRARFELSVVTQKYLTAYEAVLSGNWPPSVEVAR